MKKIIKENLFKVVVVIIVIIVVSLVFKFFTRTDVPLSIAEPESENLSTQKYAYDDKLGYGFEYPDDTWEVVTNISKDVAQCDPTQNYEIYTCVEFPYENIKKVVNFTKKQDKNLELPALQINFTVKSVTDSSEINNEFKKEIAGSGKQILSESAIKVNGIDGYDMFAGTSDWKLRQVVFFFNGMAYIFRYSSQEDLYRLNEETFNTIINSFNIKNENTANTQIANPASVNCIEKGGNHSIIDNPKGQVGMCTLSDGTICEEWAYLRGECQKNN